MSDTAIIRSSRRGLGGRVGAATILKSRYVLMGTVVAAWSKGHHGIWHVGRIVAVRHVGRSVIGGINTLGHMAGRESPDQQGFPRRN